MSSYIDLNIPAEKFAENHVINLMEQITLKNSQGIYKNYIAVATIRTDTSIPKSNKANKTDEEGFYSSSLRMY